MSLYLFIKNIVQALKESGSEEAPPAILWKKPMLILATLAAYGVFFNLLGFPLTTFLLMTLLVWVIGRRSLPLALTVSVLTVVSSYVLFVLALGQPLPMGSLWSIVGG
jgi:hypothetical protein